MKKNFAIILLAVMILGLLPRGIQAITNEQIIAEVQLLCPDAYGNWFSGSGTIIDPKGIILTNKHVVSDRFSNIILTCAVGIISETNSEPNFLTNGKINLAEVKYYTTTNKSDAALLYLENKDNKSYPFINIWDSSSSDLVFGEKIEVIGYPIIGGPTITYTSGVFSGFGSSQYGTQNYFKTTAPLEHGNSGGAAYDSSSQFVGIPTMVISGAINKLGYVLTIDSVRSWLSSLLTSEYKQVVINTESNIEHPIISIQEDVTPPDFNKLDVLCYNIYDEDNLELGARCFSDGLGKIESFNNIQFIVHNSDIEEVDESGLSKIYYYFDTKPHSLLDSSATEYTVQKHKSDRLTISNRITIDKAGTYYFSFFAVDKNNNISSPFVYEYVYEPEDFKTLQAIHFYKDSGEKYHLGSYNIDNNTGSANSSLSKAYFGAWGYGANVCYTNQNNITVVWSYPVDHDSYTIHSTNSYNTFPYFIDGKTINSNKYSLYGLSKGKRIEYKEFIHQGAHQGGIVYEIYLKPTISNGKLEHKHRLLLLGYNKNQSTEFYCVNEPTLSPLASPPPKNNINLVGRLKGYILLQVESKGEAWYLDSVSLKRYYLKDGDIAYEALRKFGLGVSSADLKKIPVGVEKRFEDIDSDGDGLADKLEEGLKTDPQNSDTDGDGIQDGVEILTNRTNPLGGGYLVQNNSLINRLKGRILLQVESRGEAWYVNPQDGKRYYMKDGDAAYQIMRFLSLGITNNDLDGIPAGVLQ